tara:strand:+ start:241 stop:417 length:177 start_codon:yes stop_codon:yes gene_type:complete
MIMIEFPKNPYNGMIFWFQETNQTFEYWYDEGEDKWFDITNEELISDELRDFLFKKND